MTKTPTSRVEVAAKIAGFPDMGELDFQAIEDLIDTISDQPAIQDVVAERAYQTHRWDEHNSTHVQPSIDSYLGLATTYLGTASCSYRNVQSNPEETLAHKRSGLIKAAAVLLQAVNHIDEGRLS